MQLDGAVRGRDADLVLLLGKRIGFQKGIQKPHNVPLVLLGGLGGLAPNRRGDIAALGMRAVLAGTLANLMSAAIAGMLL